MQNLGLCLPLSRIGPRLMHEQLSIVKLVLNYNLNFQRMDAKEYLHMVNSMTEDERSYMIKLPMFVNPIKFELWCFVIQNKFFIILSCI